MSHPQVREIPQLPVTRQLMYMFFKDMTAVARLANDTLGPVAGVKIGGNSFVFVSDHDHVVPLMKEIMVHQTPSAQISKSATAFLGYLGTSPVTEPIGETWKRLRDEMREGVGRQSAHGFRSVMFEEAVDVFNLSAGRAVNLAQICQDYGLRVIMKALAGDHGFSIKQMRRFAGTFRMVFPYMLRKGIFPNAPDAVFPYASIQYRRAIRIKNQMIRKMVARRQRNRKSGIQYHDFLQYLLDKGATIKQIIDHFTTMFIAGHETTATTLGRLLYHLAVQPETVQKLRAAILAAPSSATLEDLMNLPEIKAAVDEALRLAMASPLFARMTGEAGMTIGEYQVGPNVNVMVNALHMNRNPAWYSDPDEYVFDRSLKGLGAMNPFNIGPRTCVGMVFALEEMRALLVALLVRFDIALAPDSPKIEEKFNTGFLRATRVPSPLIVLTPKHRVLRPIAVAA